MYFKYLQYRFTRIRSNYSEKMQKKTDQKPVYQYAL